LERFKCPLFNNPKKIVRILPSVFVDKVFRVASVFSDSSLKGDDEDGHEDAHENKHQEEEEREGPGHCYY
jgi:hypothetical protein